MVGKDEDYRTPEGKWIPNKLNRGIEGPNFVNKVFC